LLHSAGNNLGYVVRGMTRVYLGSYSRG
jgi:hypothetical protein